MALGSNEPLRYVLRLVSTVLEELVDLLIDISYFGVYGCLHEELCAQLPHTGSIYKHNNISVFLLIEKASQNTPSESTVKAFARNKIKRGAYNACFSNHAGDTKYLAIYKNV